MTATTPPPAPPALTPARGLVIAGELVPGTDWIRRDPAFWWTSGRGTRPRARAVDLLVGHWTAGEAGVRDPDGPRGPLGPYDDDGPRVVRAMRSRLRADGSPMSVGITFVVGACDHGDEWAPVWQTMDPGLVGAVHVGMGSINARSIGVEVVSAGLPGRFDARERPRVRVPVLGRMLEVLRFYPGQLRSWIALAETLAALDGRGGIRIERRVPAPLATRRMTRVEVARYSGAMEHLHVPTTKKIDAGGLLLEALAGAGWALTRP